MTTKELLEALQAAAKTDRILITMHAQERMAEREISRIMIKKCIERAQISDGPSYDAEHKNYICKLKHYMSGCNYEVVAALDPANPCTVIVTVIDKD
ncbi:hypothetical protein VI06_20700 [Aquitalea magnusonii]|nr:hypothetical protein VI06_20700 [Aquitalea magnusonii]